jgi:crotonobetainyl-CoA:carnitine CoA-transferase CaiB-like acyl-CoA transferase
LNPPTGAYRTGDGWIMVALVREKQYVRLVGVLGQPDLAGDPRFTDLPHAPRIRLFSPTSSPGSLRPTRPSAGWSGYAPPTSWSTVNGFDDWLADPHIVATGGAVAVEQPEMGQFPTPRTPGNPAWGRGRVAAPRGSASTERLFSPKSVWTRRRSPDLAPRTSCSSQRRHDREL